MRFCMTLGVNKLVNKSKNKKTKIQKKTATAIIYKQNILKKISFSVAVP